MTGRGSPFVASAFLGLLIATAGVFAQDESWDESYSGGREGRGTPGPAEGSAAETEMTEAPTGEDGERARAVPGSSDQGGFCEGTSPAAWRSRLEETIATAGRAPAASALVELAESLDDQFQNSNLETVCRGELARSLLEIYCLLERRIERAPLDEDGLPQVSGIEWEADSPNAGILDDVAPFGNSDLWRVSAAGPAPECGPRVAHRRRRPRASTPTPSPAPATTPEPTNTHPAFLDFDPNAPTRTPTPAPPPPPFHYPCCWCRLEIPYQQAVCTAWVLSIGGGSFQSGRMGSEAGDMCVKPDRDQWLISRPPGTDPGRWLALYEEYQCVALPNGPYREQQEICSYVRRLRRDCRSCSSSITGLERTCDSHRLSPGHRSGPQAEDPWSTRRRLERRRPRE